MKNVFREKMEDSLCNGTIGIIRAFHYKGTQKLPVIQIKLKQIIVCEDVSSAAVYEWTGRVMQQHTLNMAT